jgi:hypothetical protein
MEFLENFWEMDTIYLGLLGMFKGEITLSLRSWIISNRLWLLAFAIPTPKISRRNA